jgi:hypothetical protein
MSDGNQLEVHEECLEKFQLLCACHEREKNIAWEFFLFISL